MSFVINLEVSNIAYRIAHIAPTSFFGDYGCHVRILEEIRALATLGHTSTVFTYPTGDNVRGITIRRNPLQRHHPEIRVGSHWGKLPLDAALLGTTLAYGLKDNFDIVHAHLHEGALIGRLLAWQQRAPLIFDFQGSLVAEMQDHGFLLSRSVLSYLLDKAERVINRLPNRIITSSRHARNLLATEFGVPASRVVEICDCVDTNMFRPRTHMPDLALNSLRTKWGIPPDHLVIGYLGLLAEYQGIPKLLAAAKLVIERFPGCHFLIMGFPGEDTYRRQALELGLQNHITFSGRIPYEMAPQMLALADIAISPKESETEGNGKLLNYMASGLPTIAFDSPVAREFLARIGTLVSPNEKALADALVYLLQQPEERTRQGELLRCRAEEHFGWDAGAKKIESVYDDLLKQ